MKIRPVKNIQISDFIFPAFQFNLNKKIMHLTSLKVIAMVVAITITNLASNAYAQEKSGVGSINPLSFFSGIFSPKPAKLTKLLDENNVSGADEFVGSERQYFLIDNKKDNQELLLRLALAINAINNPYFDSSISSISKIDGASGVLGWLDEKSTIQKAKDVLETYSKYNLLYHMEYRSGKQAELELALRDMRERLSKEAPNQFVKFDHNGSESFFQLYPHTLDGTFFGESLPQVERFIASLGKEDIGKFRNKYLEVIGKDSKLDQVLAGRFIEQSLLMSSDSQSLGKVLATIREAQNLGFTIKSMPGTKIGFVEVTSKTLLREGQIEFPTQIQMDLPFEATKVDVDSLLDSTEKSTANYVIVLDVAASRLSRRIISKSDESSSYISGSRREENPEYELARGRVFEAQMQLSNARSQSSGSSVLVAVLNGIAIAGFQNKVTQAQQAFSSTSSTVQKDEFQSYKYSTSNIDASRALTANYYVIDRSKGRYYKGTFDITENKSFKISYNVHDKDTARSSILSKFGTEADIAVYEQSPMTLPVSAIINDYLKNENSGKPLQSIAGIRTEMLQDKNKALTAYKESQFTAKAVNDARFDSVVVVSNPKGSLGTGFFVAPDLVMTNYHVIEGAQFIEMKLYSGLETFGKVVKSDVRLDLALIKVQTRGTPVSFYQGNNLDLGSTVEAIGHPKGLTFTITRGIISAVRKRPSVYGVGGKEVLFVQTDAAINPGNSGGPLFLGDKLIGVNNNKMVAGSEGLGFSIHYSEVSTFLKESF